MMKCYNDLIMENENINFKHSLDIQIRFNDLDVLNHVNNAVIQEYFDLGRLYYLQKLLKGELRTGNNTLIIASIKTDFMEPVFLENHIIVRTSVFHIGNKSLKMMQQLYDVSGEKIKAECESVMVAFDISNQESIEFPDKWRQNIIAFEDKVVVE